MGKYIWVDDNFAKWMSEQSKRLRNAGLPVGTKATSIRLLEDIIIPNKIEIQMPKLEMKQWKKKPIF